jgi:hypothetical protein
MTKAIFEETLKAVRHPITEDKEITLPIHVFSSLNGRLVIFL